MESLTLLKLDPEGDQIWKKIISDPSGTRLSSGVLRKDEFDNVYISSGKNSYKSGSFSFDQIQIKRRQCLELGL
ncbi:MAG: hypothetical protein R2942_05605 [Ignavibacteria bacterium]